jgi:predicted transcriptional regulator
MSNLTPFTVRVPEPLKEQVEQIAESIDRPRSWVVQRAIESYVATEAWQIAEIKRGLAEANAGDFASDEEVNRVFADWSR